MTMDLNKMSTAVMVAVFVLLTSIPQSEAQNNTDPCNGVDCQMGSCSPDLIFKYQCKCNANWTKLVEFAPLPCGIPDSCKFNFSCDNSSAIPPFSWAPAPVPAPAIFPLDLCSFANLCGPYGQCVSVPPAGVIPISGYKCICSAGSSNLLNMTAGVCIPTCNVQGYCQNLGVNLTPPAAPTPSNSNGANTSACANVDCWEGSCEVSTTGFPPYQCNCVNGHSNLMNIPAFPCVPDCQPNNPSCQLLCNLPTTINLTNILDPCSYDVCGAGKCLPVAGGDIFSLRCECEKGYSNFLNKSSGICLPDNCLPQCLGELGGLACGRPSGSPLISPLPPLPLAVSSQNDSDSNAGRRKEVSYVLGVLPMILVLGLW